MKKRLMLLVLVVILCSSHVVAQTTSSKRRAVRAGLPTSTDLIAAAQRSGRITAETALKYEVFAAFGDCRLPAEFRGDDGQVEFTSVLDEVAARINTLSPDGQATLAPYLREPYVSGGWVEAQQAACGPFTPSAITTKNMTILSGKVRINYVAADETRAQQVASAMQSTIYPKLTSLMGEPPRYDPNGIDPTRLSISLVGNIRRSTVGTITLPNANCNNGPSFIELPSGSSRWKAVLTSSVMGAIVRGYPVATTCRYPEYSWLEKATSAWAIDYVYPNDDSEHFYARAFQRKPELSLEHSDSNEDPHPFGAYLLPFYIWHAHQDDGFVRAMWQTAKAKLSLDAVDDALGVYGGFKDVWPDFALRNFNDLSIVDYQIYDGLTSTANSEVAYLEADPERKVEVSSATAGYLAIAPLSAQYFYYEFADTTRTIAFVNGLNFKLGIREWSIAPDFGKNFMLDNASKPHDGLKIQALLKINGTWEQTTRDWTQRPFVGFCRAFPAEHIEALALIVSNSEYKKREPIQPEGMLPAMWASNMSCAGWKTEKATYTKIAPPVTVTWDATFKRANDYTNVDPLPTLPPEGLPFLYYLYNASGTVSWGFQSSTGNCTYSGSGSAPLDGVLATWNFSPPEAQMHRAYIGVMKTDSSQRIHYTETCGNNSSTFDISVPGWAITPSDRIIRRVSSDGTTIHDSNNENLVGTSEWIMKAIPP